MHNPILDRLKSILERASALSGEERDHLLDRECGDDDHLRLQLERLLQSNDAAGSFLRSAAALDAAPEPVPAEPVGRKIGAYTILGKIGEGGFGVVYLAQQHYPIQRKVALKLIRAGTSSSQVLARFQAERQVLALMDHPNIAVVHDAGVTEEGDPYFVMEYVAGLPITTYADEQRLGLEERLRLFMQLCEAVQHAHQKGVLHRDLKPSNVLVTRSGDKSLVKVIDFGVAKAMGVQLTEETIQTQQGTVVGTPEYMSPEQAWAAPSGVDTRTDVYSLGVILYELLAGRVPFDRKDTPHAGVLGLLQQIREKDPPKLTTRFTSSRESAAIASSRRTDSPSLARRLRGDLEWITCKALEKDPGRRYSSPAAMSEDLARHLSNLPILARSPSTAYHIQKLVARHRGVTALAGTLVLAILVFAIAMSAMYNGQRVERMKAEHVVAFLRDMLASADPEHARGEQVLVRDILDQAAVKASAELGDPQLKVAVLETLAQAYDGLGLPAESLELSRSAEPIAAAVHGRNSVERAHALNALGNAFLAAGYPDSALAKLGEATTILGSGRHSHSSEMAFALGLSANALWEQGKYAESERIGRESVELYAKTLGSDQPEYAWSLAVLSIALERQGKNEEAEAAQREALAIHEEAFGSDHPDVLTSRSNLALLLAKSSKHAEAESLYRSVIDGQRRVLGEDHPQFASALNNLAVLLKGMKRYEEAESLYRQSLDISRKRVGDEHPDVATALNNLALLLVAQGRDSEAEPLYGEALKIRLKALGEQHPDVASLQHNLAVLLYYQSKLAEAETLERKALQTKIALTGPDDPDVLKSTQFLIQILLARGKTAEARTLVEDCLARQTEAKNVHVATLAWSRSLLGQCFLKEGDAAAAETLIVGNLDPILEDPGSSTRRKRAALSASIEALTLNGKRDQAALYQARLDSLPR